MAVLGRIARYRCRLGSGANGGVLVEVETDTGHRGVGESSGSPSSVTAAVVRMADAYLIGAELDGIEAIRRALVPYVGYDGAGAEASALAAIETSLWDCYARALGISLAVALGGRIRDQVRVAPEAVVEPAPSPAMAVSGQDVTALSICPLVSPANLAQAGLERRLSIVFDAAFATNESGSQPTNTAEAVALDVDGYGAADLRRHLLSMDGVRPDFLLAGLGRSGIGAIREVAVVAELIGTPMLLDGRGGAIIEAASLQLAFHLRSVAGVIVRRHHNPVADDLVAPGGWTTSMAALGLRYAQTLGHGWTMRSDRNDPGLLGGRPR